jgi:hypothetical protein
MGQQQTLYGVERPLPALPWVTCVPLGVVDSDLGGEGPLKGAIQRDELPGNLLADVALVVAIADFEIGLVTFAVLACSAAREMMTQFGRKRDRDDPSGFA